MCPSFAAEGNGFCRVLTTFDQSASVHHSIRGGGAGNFYWRQAVSPSAGAI